MCGTPQRSRRISTGSRNPATFSARSGARSSSNGTKTLLAANVLRHPVDMPMHDIQHELGFLRSVRRARINHHLGGHALAFDRDRKSTRLNSSHVSEYRM